MYFQKKSEHVSTLAKVIIIGDRKGAILILRNVLSYYQIKNILSVLVEFPLLLNMKLNTLMIGYKTKSSSYTVIMKIKRVKFAEDITAEGRLSVSRLSKTSVHGMHSSW